MNVSVGDFEFEWLGDWWTVHEASFDQMITFAQ
jgi:hypothetical protein